MCGSVSLGFVVSFAVSVVSRIRVAGSAAGLLEAHPATAALTRTARINRLIDLLPLVVWIADRSVVPVAFRQRVPHRLLHQRRRLHLPPLPSRLRVPVDTHHLGGIGQGPSAGLTLVLEPGGGQPDDDA
jgi:hypothetical protein